MQQNILQQLCNVSMWVGYVNLPRQPVIWPT